MVRCIRASAFLHTTRRVQLFTNSQKELQVLKATCCFLCPVQPSRHLTAAIQMHLNIAYSLSAFSQKACALHQGSYVSLHGKLMHLPSHLQILFPISHSWTAKVAQMEVGSLPAASFACRALFAPGMGTAPLQIVQLMATYRYRQSNEPDLQASILLLVQP